MPPLGGASSSIFPCNHGASHSRLSPGQASSGDLVALTGACATSSSIGELCALHVHTIAPGLLKGTEDATSAFGHHTDSLSNVAVSLQSFGCFASCPLILDEVTWLSSGEHGQILFLSHWLPSAHLLIYLSFLFFGEWMGYTFLLLLGLISVLREFALPASLCLGVGLGAFRGRWTPYQ